MLYSYLPGKLVFARQCKFCEDILYVRHICFMQMRFLLIQLIGGGTMGAHTRFSVIMPHTINCGMRLSMHCIKLVKPSHGVCETFWPGQSNWSKQSLVAGWHHATKAMVRAGKQPWMPARYLARSGLQKKAGALLAFYKESHFWMQETCILHISTSANINPAVCNIKWNICFKN